MQHQTRVDVIAGRYPYRPVCSCGQAFRGYVAEHAARQVAEAHAEEATTITQVVEGVAGGWRQVTINGEVIRCTDRELAARVNSGEWRVTPQAEADMVRVRREARGVYQA